MQPMARTTFIHNSIGIGDRAKSNRGGLDSPDTLIDQGDIPVNVEDLKDADKYNLESKMMVDDDMDYESPYVEAVHSEGDMEDGVGFSRTMYPHEHIRKNSDY